MVKTYYDDICTNCIVCSNRRIYPGDITTLSLMYPHKKDLDSALVCNECLYNLTHIFDRHYCTYCDNVYSKCMMCNNIRACVELHDNIKNYTNVCADCYKIHLTRKSDEICRICQNRLSRRNKKHGSPINYNNMINRLNMTDFRNELIQIYKQKKTVVLNANMIG